VKTVSLCALTLELTLWNHYSFDEEGGERENSSATSDCMSHCGACFHALSTEPSGSSDTDLDADTDTNVDKK